ncbi:phospholipase D-like domain-containing protein [Shimia biformata]|uniref:phospholipase D-like domain-containing protein n=1 Tax=Shimia biformata TaxID=1294299 RepID=UPI00194DDE9E|nr:phospholipase D family protein [Shimia biformata]
MVLTPTLPRLLAVAASVILVSCTQPPLDAPREVTRFNIVDGSPYDGRKVSVAQDRNQSVYFDLTEGRDALGARMNMIGNARKTIDVSTFLIKPDTAGRLFAAKLIEAADRGVRVRLLIDDVFTTTRDSDLALVDAHENIEVRMFNPSARGVPKALAFPFDFKRLNRRMHNKMFVVDNAMAIIGGRNIADEYYQLDTSAVFADFEIFTAGPDAAKLGGLFDTFWNDKYAVPLDMIVTDTARRRADAQFVDWDVDAHPEERAAYRDALASPYLKRILNGSEKPHFGKAWIITDPPQKLRNPVAEGPHAIANALFTEMKHAKREVVMLTPYFVPEDYGVKFYKSLVDSGIRVRIVTNSLAANNHPYVHGGYQPYRKDLLQAGVELYEVRADVPELLGVDDDGVGPDKLTMHSKMGIIDNDKVFVGSLNLDPRAIKLNTEHGMMIHSPSLARALRGNIDSALRNYAYRVDLDENGNLVWDYFGFGKAERRLSEPQATGFQKLIANITDLLGVELQL